VSTAYFIVLDKETPGFDPAVNGKFLARDASRIAKVAKALGLRGLDDYVSYSPEEARGIMEDLGATPDQIAANLPEQQWFDPQEGLDFVAKLTAHLKANPSAVKNAKGVLSDLAEYKEVFEQARAVGARWNLRVDF
jgi:hypothetical protein